MKIIDTLGLRRQDRLQNNINNRTIIIMRWLAILGQSIAILVTHFLLSVPLPLLICFLCIACSFVLNTLSQFLGRWTVRSGEAMFYLAFDVIQISALLFLSGGLENPFSVLMLGPIAVCASLLPFMQTALLTALSILCATILYFDAMELAIPGQIFEFPSLYLIGNWLAIMFTIVFIAFYIWRTSMDSRIFAQALEEMQISLSQYRQMNAVGAQAAAAAHELGSPLSTISIIAKDIQTELRDDHPLSEDAKLLISQIERCKNILQDLAKYPENNETSILTDIPMQAFINVVAEPYMMNAPHIHVEIQTKSAHETDIPISISAELNYGLGNIIQNAIQYAQERVTINIERDPYFLIVTVTDDGPGFDEQILERIGEPYISSRSGTGQHMGLGIFIAKHLLEKSGGKTEFLNSQDGHGMVRIAWPRKTIESRAKAA